MYVSRALREQVVVCGKAQEASLQPLPVKRGTNGRTVRPTVLLYRYGTTARIPYHTYEPVPQTVVHLFLYSQMFRNYRYYGYVLIKGYAVHATGTFDVSKNPVRYRTYLLHVRTHNRLVLAIPAKTVIILPSFRAGGSMIPYVYACILSARGPLSLL